MYPVWFLYRSLTSDDERPSKKTVIAAGQNRKPPLSAVAPGTAGELLLVPPGLSHYPN